MIELATHILDSKAAHFDPSKFKDEYEDALKKLVKRKAAGKPIKATEPEEKPSNVISLMDALKQSLKGKAAAKSSARAPVRRRGPQRRTAKKAHRSTARQRKAG
jgi:DNA end-binding protein Ku